MKLVNKLLLILCFLGMVAQGSWEFRHQVSGSSDPERLKTLRKYSLESHLLRLGGEAAEIDKKIKAAEAAKTAPGNSIKLTESLASNMEFAPASAPLIPHGSDLARKDSTATSHRVQSSASRD